MKELLKKYKEIILYFIFGVLTTIVNVIVYSIGTKMFNLNYQISNIIAWIVSVIFAFITNKLYVFESKDKSLKVILKEGLSFCGCRIFSLGADLATMYIMVSILNINDIIAKIAANIVVAIINYVFSKLIIFKKEK